MTDDSHYFTQRPTTVRYRVTAWLSTAAVLAYFCRNSVGVAESSIRESLKLTEAETGWMLGAFFWTYALFQVPAGYVGQRYGTRKVLGASAVLWSLGIMMMGSAPNLTVLIAAQALMGLAQAAVFPCAVQSVSAWIPKPNRATACASLTIGMQVGAVVTASLTGSLITEWDWRIVFLGYAVPGILWAIGFLARFTDHPQNHAGLNDAERQLLRLDQAAENAADAKDRPPAPWRAIFQNRSVFFLCGQQAFRAAGYAFFATWFPSFLQGTRGVDVKSSGYLQSSVFAATMFGGLLGGVLVDLIYKRTDNLKLSRSGVGAVCMLSCGALIFAAFFAESLTAAVVLLAMGAFMAALAGPCAYVTTIDLGQEHVPAVFGLMNMIGNLAAAATPTLIGYLFKYTSNWNLVLALFGGMYLVAAICWWLVDPRDAIVPDPEPTEDIP